MPEVGEFLNAGYESVIGHFAGVGDRRNTPYCVGHLWCGDNNTSFNREGFWVFFLLGCLSFLLAAVILVRTCIAIFVPKKKKKKIKHFKCFHRVESSLPRYLRRQRKIFFDKNVCCGSV